MNKHAMHFSLVLSLLLHSFIAAFIVLGPTPTPPPISTAIELIDINDSHEIRRQIVDQAETPINNELDENAKYLSAHNQKVAKETLAKHRGDFKNTPSKADMPGKAGTSKPLTADDLRPKMDYLKSYQEMLDLEKNKEQEMLQVAQKQKPKKEARSPEKGNNGGPVSQTIDYIKELDPGLETLLTTREFVYYTYYARVRRQLNQHWTPKVKEKITKIYREGRRIASTDDRITRCLVTLDKAGKLIKVQVIGNSGVQELDEAAVEAFRAAAPFPNPPTGIVEQDGTIKIRWDFILEA